MNRNVSVQNDKMNMVMANMCMCPMQMCICTVQLNKVSFHTNRCH